MKLNKNKINNAIASFDPATLEFRTKYERKQKENSI